MKYFGMQKTHCNVSLTALIGLRRPMVGNVNLLFNLPGRKYDKNIALLCCATCTMSLREWEDQV